MQLEFRRISDYAWVDTTERFCLSRAQVSGEWVYTAARRSTKKGDEDDGYAFKWEPICTSKDLRLGPRGDRRRSGRPARRVTIAPPAVGQAGVLSFKGVARCLVRGNED